jgi:hypothetical protein
MEHVVAERTNAIKTRGLKKPDLDVNVIIDEESGIG